jgi:hypothetical protein
MSIRTKAAAAANEAKDIAFIVNAIHGKTTMGMRFISAFHTAFGDTLLDARPRQGSNRGTHYDFDALVRFKDGSEIWKHVEHKGAKGGAIKDGEKPWAAGVQFHNGGCDKYTITRDYAKLHHETHIASGNLTRQWGIASPAPSFEEWWKSDCCRQDDPGTAFGKELKAAVRVVRGPKGSLLAERAPVVAALLDTEEVKAQLAKEVLPIANSVLEMKDYWLTVRGSLEAGDFALAWNPKFVIGAINEVVITKKKDVLFDFHCSDDFRFKGIMRWGKGAGFSCLRIDLK